MNVVFADTSFYAAFTNPSDSWHRIAKRFAFEYQGAMVTTDFVLVEFGNHLRAPHNRDLFLRWNRMLREDPNTRIVPASPQLVQAGLHCTQTGRTRAGHWWIACQCLSWPSRA